MRFSRKTLTLSFLFVSSVPLPAMMHYGQVDFSTTQILIKVDKLAAEEDYIDQGYLLQVASIPPPRRIRIDCFEITSSTIPHLTSIHSNATLIISSRGHALSLSLNSEVKHQ